ncbi:hypothetical protein HPB50_026718 [Hyalomma asiaticum]|uniref:Uncharacterized protein n=1 Tax=Hyalomma asiaticum TaxID=266040 RepID=A0ACB7RNP1_HYAAI|nr:hypothetical protein HPB50_026718 [Hyalomma asiaticum]
MDVSARQVVLLQSLVPQNLGTDSVEMSVHTAMASWDQPRKKLGVQRAGVTQAQVLTDLLQQPDPDASKVNRCMD